MPGRKKVLSVDRANAIKNRRRDIYKQVSADKKEALLLQRRTGLQESNNHNLVTDYLPVLPNTQLPLPRQWGITIRELPCQLPTDSTSHNDTSTAVQDKGKNIVSSVRIFERGSTLDAPTEQYNPDSTTAPRGSSSTFPQQHDPEAMADRYKGNELRACNT